MAKEYIYLRRKKSGVAFIIIMLVFFSGLGVSYMLAGRWQAFERQQDEIIQSQAALMSTSFYLTATPDAAPVTTAITKASGMGSTGQIFSGENSPYGAVAEGEPVEDSYFDDAVFIGDSRSQGLIWVEAGRRATLLTDIGINTDTIITKKAIEMPDGQSLTVLEALAQAPNSKIYIMLGTNDIGWMTVEMLTDKYGRFLDEVIKTCPDSIIYVQSILPVTIEKSKEEMYANSRIDQVNAALYELACEKGCYYLDIAGAMKDENGNLPDSIAAVDGLHIGVAGYNQWMDYLKRHVVASDQPAN